MFKGINRLKIVMPVLITLALLILLFLTLLASVDYSLEEINWGDFAFSMFYWITGRMTYFPLGVEIGEQNKEVKLLENTISKYRREIYQTKMTKVVGDKFKYRNILSKANAYLDEIDIKLTKLSDKQSKRKAKKCDRLLQEREVIIDFIDKFENGVKYKGKFNINNVRVKYDVLDFGTCFSYGNEARKKGHKYRINVQTEGVKKSVPAFIWTILMSFMSASISYLQYGFTWMALFTFVIKLLLFLMGCFNGLTLGKSVIETDKYNVLLNITEEVKSVITEVEKEENIEIDVPEEVKG